MEETGGSPREMTNAQIKLLRGAFEDEDVGHYLMATQLFGYKDLIPELHLPISRFLGKWGHSETTINGHIWTPPNEDDGDVIDSDRRLMVCIPRECFKTSLCTRVGAFYVLAKNHDATIGMFNEKEENAEAWTGSICEVIERSLLIQILWRDMIPKGIGFWDVEKGVTRPRSLKWGASGMKVERGAIGIPELSIEPSGIGGAVTGKHFTHKILDDIIGEKSAYSPAIMQDAINWVDNARPLERPAENGCELVVHTTWAFADVYAHMIKKWMGEYKVHKRHLLEDADGRASLQGKSIFPKKISTKKALQMHKVDAYHFWAQYMCVPKAGKKMDFADEWFRFGTITYSGSEPVFAIDREHYDPDIYEININEPRPNPPRLVPFSWIAKGIVFDPIPGKRDPKEPNCMHGVAAVGVDPWGRRIMFESFRSDSVEMDICLEVLQLARKWAAARIGIEEVNFSYLYQPLLKLVAEKEYGDWCPQIIGLITGGRQKEQRVIEDLKPTHQRGFWYYNRVGTSEAIEELTEFPHSTYKDVSDAHAYTDQLISRPDTPAESLQAMYRKHQDAEERGVTGYGF